MKLARKNNIFIFEYINPKIGIKEGRKIYLSWKIFCLPVKKQEFIINICLIKVNNRNTTKRCEICSKLTIKNVVLVFLLLILEHVSRIFLVFPLLTLNRYMLARFVVTWKCMSIDGLINCDALCDLVPFIQFQKREKHRWGIVTFSKVEGLN